MLLNTAYGDVKDLPFDLVFKRQMLYNFSEGDINKPKVRANLSHQITKAVTRTWSREMDTL